MNDITGIIIVKNAQDTIERALSSLSWCRQIVVIDDYSTDNTVKIAKRSGARVFYRRLNGNFSLQRNFALSKINTKWSLFIDSDEEVSKELQKEIIKNISTSNSNYDGFLIRRIDIWQGRQLKSGEVGRVLLVRLGKTKKGKWSRAVHENWEIDGVIGILKNPIFHLPHPTVSDFVENISFYAPIHAKEIKREGKSVLPLAFLIFPIGKFLRDFIIRGGYKDGIHGFIYSVMMSFHSFIAWGILWKTKNRKAISGEN